MVNRDATKRTHSTSSLHIRVFPTSTPSRIGNSTGGGDKSGTGRSAVKVGFSVSRALYRYQLILEAALQKYEVSAREVTNDWLLSLSASVGRPVNTSLYSLLIPFDNIGKVGYSHHFGTVKAGCENRIVNLMETNFRAAGELGQLAWPLGIVQRLGLSRDATEFDGLVVNLADKRIKVLSR